MSKLTAIIEVDYIKITDETGKEIVGWNRDEWEEDKESVIPAIGNAIALAYTDPNKLLKLIKPNNIQSL